MNEEWKQMFGAASDKPVLVGAVGATQPGDKLNSSSTISSGTDRNSSASFDRNLKTPDSVDLMNVSQSSTSSAVLLTNNSAATSSSGSAGVGGQQKDGGGFTSKQKIPLCKLNMRLLLQRKIERYK